MLHGEVVSYPKTGVTGLLILHFSRYSPPQCSHTMLHGEVVSCPKTGVTGLLILHFSRSSPPQCSHTMLHGEVVSYRKSGVTGLLISIFQGVHHLSVAILCCMVKWCLTLKQGLLVTLLKTGLHLLEAFTISIFPYSPAL